jgi:hypothetical protein
VRAAVNWRIEGIVHDGCTQFRDLHEALANRLSELARAGDLRPSSTGKGSGYKFAGPDMRSRADQTVVSIGHPIDALLHAK